MGLITLDKLKECLSITGSTDNDFLNGQIALFSSAIESYCRRKFELATYTQTFYYSDYAERDEDRRTLWLFHFPSPTITEIRHITTYEGTDSSEVVDANGYRLRKELGRLQKFDEGLPDSWFNSSRYFLTCGLNSRIEVDYSAGYTEVPLEIQDVMCSLIGERYSKKKAGVDLSFGNDVQRISIPGTMSIDFDYSLQANERSTRLSMLLGNYVNVLDIFRSERALTGEIKENYVD